MILGQSAPVAATPTLLYEVPRGSAKAWVSALFVCNRGAGADTFRVWIGDGVGNEEYLYYDLPIAANDTFMMTCEADDKASIQLLNGDQVWIEAGGNDLSFNLFGKQE